MELTNDFEVGVPVEQAWEVLTDLERIAPCMPGAKLEEVEGDEYRGIVKVKVGPVTAQYKGTATISEKDDAAHRAVLNASGRDTRGQGNANAVITAQLTESGDKTRVELKTDLNITGKVAQFGRGVMADVSGKLLGQFVENLESTVLSGSSAAETTEPAAAAEPASAAPIDVDELVDSAAEPAEPAVPKPVAKKAAKKAVKKVAVTKPPTAASATPSSTTTAAAERASTAASGASNGAVSSTGPAVRKIDSPEPEPVDLLDAAGGSVAQRIVPIVIGAVVLLLVFRFIRRRRRQRS
jgi:carbon monoxide dehydrogenase subunit G